MRENSVDQRILQRIVRGVRAVRQTLHGENGDSKLNFLQIAFANCVFFGLVAHLYRPESLFFAPGDRLDASNRGVEILFHLFVGITSLPVVLNLGLAVALLITPILPERGFYGFAAGYSLLNPVRSLITVKLPSVRAESLRKCAG